ncbi:MAG: hypothetical protein MUO26_00930 [Methanotrichaceae archaeon]|nr:hypothetical protein [Methanotrichaceae archaeon]
MDTTRIKRKTSPGSYMIGSMEILRRRLTSMGEGGLTVQCGYDVDNHEGTNPAWPRVLALKTHIEELGLQAIPVASGSSDSYHVFIPTLSKPGKTVSESLKDVLNEVKRKHPDMDWRSIEIFPKQTTKHRTYGNALKLPGAVNQRTGVRSYLVGVDENLEPVPIDAVFITRVAELQDPVEEVEKVGERLYLRYAELRIPIPRGPMRQCLVDALTKQLDEGDGNEMLVAIADEALSSRMARDEVINLFTGQDYFVEATTARYVDFIIGRCCHRWKCEKIQDKCGRFVDCERCPRNSVKVTVALAAATDVFAEPVVQTWFI